MSTETPTLSDVLDLVLADDRAHLFVALPGRVESYDAAKQVANVKPMTKRLSRNADDDRLVDDLPVLPAVPVVWPRGGGYFLAMPLAAGDGGLIVCCDADLGAWRDSGQVSDPGDERLHSLTGAVFIPGLDTVARALATAGTGHLVLGKDSGGPTIHVDPSFVQLGASGGDFVAIAGHLMNYLTALKGAISTGLAGVPAAGAGLQTAFNAAMALAPVLADFNGIPATLVKAT